MCLSRVYSVRGNIREPQRLEAAEPQAKCERPLNRRDAMSAEKTAGEKILLEMRDSDLLHCEERREEGEGEHAQSDRVPVTDLQVTEPGLALRPLRLCGL